MFVLILCVCIFQMIIGFFILYSSIQTKLIVLHWYKQLKIVLYFCYSRNQMIIYQRIVLSHTAGFEFSSSISQRSNVSCIPFVAVINYIMYFEKVDWIFSFIDENVLTQYLNRIGMLEYIKYITRCKYWEKYAEPSNINIQISRSFSMISNVRIGTYKFLESIKASEHTHWMNGRSSKNITIEFQSDSLLTKFRHLNKFIHIGDKTMLRIHT